MSKLALVALLIGCSPSVPPPRRASPSPPAAAGEPVACCADYDAIKAADGKRVVLVGVYRPMFVVKRAASDRDPTHIDPEARTVAIQADANLAVMLGVYYAPQGERPADEIARFSGKRVRVVGTLHAHTPSQTEDAIVMQTMTGPYLGELDPIREAGDP